MNVLVTAGSKHGATAEIARAIGEQFVRSGINASVAEPDDVATLDGVDAVVLGSGVYAGHWLDPATAFVERFRDSLRQQPVWLFSSGPVGDPPVPRDTGVDVDAVMQATGARAHEVFAGRVDRDLLGFGERALVRALRVPEGDWRDWDAIERWAGEIAAVLAGEPVGSR